MSKENHNIVSVIVALPLYQRNCFSLFMTVWHCVCILFCISSDAEGILSWKIDGGYHRLFRAQLWCQTYWWTFYFGRVNEVSARCQIGKKKKKPYRGRVQHVGISVHRKHCGPSTLGDTHTTQAVSIFHCDQNLTVNRFNRYSVLSPSPPWAAQVTEGEACWLDVSHWHAPGESKTTSFILCTHSPCFIKEPGVFYYRFSSVLLMKLSCPFIQTLNALRDSSDFFYVEPASNLIPFTPPVKISSVGSLHWIFSTFFLFIKSFSAIFLLFLQKITFCFHQNCTFLFQSLHISGLCERRMSVLVLEPGANRDIWWNPLLVILLTYVAALKIHQITEA